ncbi:MAG: mannonate dehydratase [Candidatus Latescibacteria bacterium]|nr:mannonate dehydratase [Candidatus Latescibacterota bacterium]
MKIAVNLPPEPGLPWTLMRQCGVEHAVCHKGLKTIPNAPEDEQPWSLTGLRGWKETYEKIGVELAVIEGRPGMENIKLALPGRDEEIDVVCHMLRNMGELGIPVWCSSWMPILGVMRTSRDQPTRGGATVIAYHHEHVRDEPLTEHGVVTEEQQWENLKYFLERVVPVAEEAGVKMAMHPDDPPLSPIRGVARIMSTIDNYQRLIDLVPSPMNGIGLCQGNFALMTDDLPAAIRHFGEQDRIHFVHMRDVRGTPDHFQEAFHDDGQSDLVECWRAYKDAGVGGVCRPDHYPAMGDGEYADELRIARLFAVGYLKGIREAVYAEN